ncbi:MAG: VWA domain-containing protein [Candidatus Bathyarchaeota archaeon]|nr:MAG: VWA domain-containing protein [Candidatus Bathyarchaeota archaeon]
MRSQIPFPFTAIVNMDKLKLAILINAINPSIGGLLIRGPKGSGKTTAVRALTTILTKIQVVQTCPFNCNPSDHSNLCEKCSATYQKDGKFPIQEREMKVVELPLGATEDRVVGSLDIEKAIKHGIEAMEPGILAEANQNILYVDEINLLPDHISDDLLDAAATGWNTVEREGISVGHPSRFIFIGTMNPEEGELRPQLLDRFPLSVTVERITTAEARMEVVRRNLEFEANPRAFIRKYKGLQKELKKQISQARIILPRVVLSDGLLDAICKTSIELKVDGMRPDIVISKTASTLAALERRTQVTPDDVLLASEFALSHRTREGGFLEPATADEIRKIFRAKIKDLRYVEDRGPSEEEKGLEKKRPKGKTMIWTSEFSDPLAREAEEEKVRKFHRKARGRIWAFFSRLSPVFGFGKRLEKAPRDAPVSDGVMKGPSKLKGPTFKESDPKSLGKGIPSVSIAVKQAQFDEGISILTRIKATVLKPLELAFKINPTHRMQSCYAGKRAETFTTLHRGRSRGSRVPHGKPKDIHLPATIRNAARKQRYRGKSLGNLLKVHIEDVREKLRFYKAPITLVFLIDVSGSMLLSIEEVKEALMKLHRDAYRYRDKVGIVALKDMGAGVVQHPIANLRVVANKLMNLRISGLTPLAAGMLKSLEVLKKAQRRDRSTIPVMIIVTDGNANIPLKRSLETGEIRSIDETSAIVREYEDLAVQDVMLVSKLIRKEKVNTIIINTNPHHYGRETYGFAVTKSMASKMNGTHHAIGRLTTESEFIGDMVEKIIEDQRLIAHKASQDMFD